MPCPVAQRNFCPSLKSPGDALAYLGAPNIFEIKNLIPNGRDLIPEYTERDNANYSI